MIKKICVVTGSRAEYGQLYSLIKRISSSNKLKLQIIVSGMHLSPEFGLTFKEIQRDFKINKKIDMLLSSDTHIGISKSMGLAQISFAEAYDELKPDFVLIIGDRYEIFPAATAALIAQIPIIHLHGGEKTEGAIDESIRHSITKMSYLHFTASEEYKKRVIQLGENPNRVFNVGGIGVDMIQKQKLLTKKNFEKSIKFKLNIKNILVAFHSVTLEKNTAKLQFQQILNSIKNLKDTNIIFTKTNSDIGGRIINEMIEKFVKKNSNKAVAFTSLGQLRYLSALSHVDAIIGNSSSGLSEAPSFKIGTINIGDRQRGRIGATSVINCLPQKKNIIKAIKKIYSKKFQNDLKYTKNPYGIGGASIKIIKILEKIPKPSTIKKKFYDIKI
jgi:GDP/UDP-N,N'-diacetylbacillosamine 2-epimerase (hydrolysing)